MEVHQLMFVEVITEADERNRAAQDELKVKRAGAVRPADHPQKDALGLWLSGSAAFDAHVALAAAAGDWWHHVRQALLLRMPRIGQLGTRREVGRGDNLNRPDQGPAFFGSPIRCFGVACVHGPCLA